MKSKGKVVHTLQDLLWKMAMDKFGSRVLDKMYASVTEKLQDIIRTELRKHKHKLESNMYGRIVLSNCQLKQMTSDTQPDKEKILKRKAEFEKIIATKQVKPEAKQPSVPMNVQKKVVEPPVKKKKLDRAERYREELRKMGITVPGDENVEKEEKPKPIANTVKEEENVRIQLDAILLNIPK